MDKEGSMDLSGAFAKLLENPEALKSALGIASALKDSGALEGLSKATGEEKVHTMKKTHTKKRKEPPLFPRKKGLLPRWATTESAASSCLWPFVPI